MSPIAIDTPVQATPAVKAEQAVLKNELTVPATVPVDYDQFLSEESASRYPSPLKFVNLK